MATFYERFCFLLNQNPEIKQKDIVNSTKIDKTSISKYANGKAVPDAENLFKIANMFSVSPTWLLGDDVPSTVTTMETNSSIHVNFRDGVNNPFTTSQHQLIMYNGTDPLKKEIAQITQRILDKIDNPDILIMLKNILDGINKK